MAPRLGMEVASPAMATNFSVLRAALDRRLDAHPDGDDIRSQAVADMARDLAESEAVGRDDTPSGVEV